MYEVLDGFLIEVMMIGELSLGQPKGGRGHLIEMPIQQKRFKFLFFVTIISGLWSQPA